MKNKKTIVLFIASILMVTSLVNISSAFPSDDDQDIIVISYHFDKPKIDRITVDGQPYSRVSVSDCDRSQHAGAPALPMKTVRILLPPHSTVKSVEVEKSGKGVISNVDNIELGPVEYNILGTEDTSFYTITPDENVVAYFDNANNPSQLKKIMPEYDATHIYPETAFAESGVQYKRGFPILMVDLYPVQYDSSSQTITYYTHMTVKVSTEKDNSLPLNPLFRGLSRDFAIIGDTVDNPSILDEYNGVNPSSSENSSGNNMLIITTENLKNMPGSYSIQALADTHKNNGIDNVYIETVESIYSKYNLDGPSHPINGDHLGHSLKIRECVKDYYLNHGVDYVLLVGDDDYEWENGMIFPMLIAPLIRYKNIVDENEVPTFQLYLYTVAIYKIVGGMTEVTPPDNDAPHRDLEDGPVHKVPGSNITTPDTSSDCESESGSAIPGPSVTNPDESNPPSADDDISSGHQIEMDSDMSDETSGEYDISDIVVEPRQDIPSSDDILSVEMPLGYRPRDPPSTLKLVAKWDITTASDLPYSCLDDDYYFSGDNWLNKGTPHFLYSDLFAEVYVGRAPVSDTRDLTNFVKKTISYINAPAYQYSKVLMIGERLGFGGPSEYGATSMDELVDECSNHGYTTVGIPSISYSIERLYEKLGWWTGNTLINKINTGKINLVNHLGHANVRFNMKLGTPGYRQHGAKQVTDFKNTQYPIFYSQGCFAGAFDSGRVTKSFLGWSGVPFGEYKDCIAEYMTVKTDHCGVAGIWNSHFGWGMRASTDGPSQRYHREFIDAIFGEGKSTLGWANQDSKEDNVGRLDSYPMIWLYFCINLLGDPALHVKGAPYTPPLDDDSDDTNDGNNTDDSSGNDNSDDDSSGDNDDGDTFLDILRIFIRNLIDRMFKNLQQAKS